MVNVALEITAARPDPALLDLPWHLPLEDLARGATSRPCPAASPGTSCVSCASSNRVLAVKEIKADIATASTRCCATSAASTCPASSPSASSAAGEQEDGEPLDACLITRHLQFSLPYRALFSQTLRPDTAVRLMDALALLLVRLHLGGLLVG